MTNPTLPPPAAGLAPRHGDAFAISCAVSAGLAIALGKGASPAFPRPVFLAIMFVVATLGSAVWLVGIRGRRPVWPTGRGALYLVAQVALAVPALWSYWSGIERLDPTVAVFLARSETLFTVLVSILFLGERFSLAEVAGAAVAVAGIVVIHGEPTDAGHAGFWLALGGAGLLGASEIFSKLAVRHVDPATFVLWRSGLLAAVFVAWASARGDWVVPVTRDVVAAAGAGLFAPVLGRTLFMLSLRAIDLSRAAVINLSQPLFTAAFAWWLYATTPRAREWAGGTLVVAGLAMLLLARRIVRRARA